MCTCSKNFLKYNVSTVVYTEAGDCRLDKYCNGLLLHNSGTTNVIVAGDTIVPGQSKTIGGNAGEVFVGPMEIKFRTPSPAPPIATNSVTVTQKYYTFPE